MPLSRRSARALRVAAILLGGALLLAAIAAVGARWLVTPDILRAALSNQAHKLGATLDVAHAHIALLPLPHLALDGVRFAIPARATGTVRRLAVYPRLATLLRGKLEVATLDLDAPVVALQLPPPAAAGAVAALASVSEVPVWLGGALRDLAAAAADTVPGLDVTVSNGSLTVLRDGTDPLTLDALAGRLRLPPAAFAATLRCRSSLWERLSVDVALDAEQFSGEGTVVLERADLAALARHAGVTTEGLIAASPGNLDLRLVFEPLQTIRAQAHAQLPMVTLQRGDQRGGVGGGALDASLTLSHDRVEVSLSNGEIQAPRLSISGSFSIDATTPVATLTLRGTQIDVAPVAAAVALVVGDQPTARAIFGVLQGGTVPSITLDARAPFAANLFNVHNFELRGQLVAGRIFVPKIGLQLEDVVGGARVAQGILEGEHAQGRSGRSTASDGRLRVGLTDDSSGVFFLDAQVAADVADLPSVLQRSVRDADFLSLLRRIQHAEGQAVGQLTLRAVPHGFETRVAVTTFSAGLDADFLPQRLQLTGGRFGYESGAITLDSVRADMGQSWLSALTARVDMQTPSALEAQAGVSSVSLSDVRAWLAFLGMQPSLQRVSPIGGVLNCDTLRVHGPLATPGQWQFEISGTASDAQLDIPPHLGKTTISGQFTATPDAITLAGAQVSFEDAHLTGSGRVDGYQTAEIRHQISADGQLGPLAVRRLLESMDLNDQLRVRRTLAIAGVRLATQPGTLSLSGTFTEQSGPAVTVDMQWTPARLSVRQLAISSTRSNAKITADVRLPPFPETGTGGGPDIALSFDGNLTASTLDALIEHNPYLRGALRGDFRVAAAPQPPFRVDAGGTLFGSDLVYPLGPDESIHVDSIAIRGAGPDVHVEPAVVLWSGDRVRVSGSVTPEGNGATVDLNVGTADFDWDKVDRLLAHSNAPRRSARAATDAFPLRGTVRAQCDAFSFGRFTWRPFRAEFVLAPGVVDLTVADANLCGIRTSGGSRLRRDSFDLALEARAHAENLADSVACFFKRRDLIDGQFDFDADVTNEGQYGHALDDLQGRLRFTARNGRIHQMGLFANLFSALSATQIFFGRLPDLTWNALAYQSLTVSAQLEEGRLVLSDATLQSSALSLVARGAIDLRSATADLTVLAAPLSFVDSIMHRIPLIRRLWPKHLVSIPMRVTGPIANPSVIPLAPSAVTDELTGLLRRTVQLPIDIIQPLMPGKDRRPTQ